MYFLLINGSVKHYALRSLYYIHRLEDSETELSQLLVEDKWCIWECHRALDTLDRSCCVSCCTHEICHWAARSTWWSVAAVLCCEDMCCVLVVLECELFLAEWIRNNSESTCICIWILHSWNNLNLVSRCIHDTIAVITLNALLCLSSSMLTETITPIHNKYGGTRVLARDTVNFVFYLF